MLLVGNKLASSICRHPMIHSYHSGC